MKESYYASNCDTYLGNDYIYLKAYALLYFPVAKSLGRSKAPSNQMTTMLAVNMFKSAGAGHSGQRHANGTSGRRVIENNLVPPQHSSTG